MKKLMFLIAAIFLLVNCSDSNDDSGTNNRIFKVNVGTTSKSRSVGDLVPGSTPAAEADFDESGKITKISVYGTMFETNRYEFVYDESGDIIEKHSYEVNAGSATLLYTKYYNYVDGKLSSAFYDCVNPADDYDVYYTYDAKDNITQVLRKNSLDVEKERCDFTYLDDKKETMKYYQNGNQSYIITFEYSANKMICNFEDTQGASYPYSKRIYNYDEDTGNITSLELYGSAETIEGISDIPTYIKNYTYEEEEGETVDNSWYMIFAADDVVNYF